MLKIVSIVLISAIIIIYLKSINSELTFIALAGAGIIIIYFSLEYIASTSSFIIKLINLSGVDKQYFEIIFKIMAIAYIVEFAAGIVEDFGLNSLAKKLVFVGKLIILSLALPIIYSVFNLFTGILQ